MYSLNIYNFEYKHNSTIKLETSIGQIELIFKVRKDADEEARKVWGQLFETMEDLPHDEPAMNEDTYFVAHLIESGRITCTRYAVMADEAVKELYRWNAVRQFEAEFAPKEQINF